MQNLRFPGQYYDAETNLHYNMARYYDTSIGRYITSDPIGLQGGVNTYLYANANPVRSIDPLGLISTSNANNEQVAIGIEDIIQEILIDMLFGEPSAEDKAAVACAQRNCGGRKPDFQTAVAICSELLEPILRRNERPFANPTGDGIILSCASKCLDKYEEICEENQVACR